MYDLKRTRVFVCGFVNIFLEYVSAVWLRFCVHYERVFGGIIKSNIVIKCTVRCGFECVCVFVTVVSSMLFRVIDQCCMICGYVKKAYSVFDVGV